LAHFMLQYTHRTKRKQFLERNRTMNTPEYEITDFSQIAINDREYTYNQLTDLAHFGMSVIEIANRTDISPATIGDVFRWYNREDQQ